MSCGMNGQLMLVPRAYAAADTGASCDERAITSTPGCATVMVAVPVLVGSATERAVMA